MLRTPLYQSHVALGARIVPFAGYEMPVQYSGIVAEHNAVRNEAGLFDVSHMGEITLKGPDALNNLQMLLCNDYADLADGFVRYSPMCNESGGVVDDLLVYKKADQDYLIVVNASNKDKDFAWILAHLRGDAKAEDISDTIGQIALQGPKAAAILDRLLTDKRPLELVNYSFLDGVSVAGVPCLVSRTGYTGEDGFELYCPAEQTPALWDALLGAGREFGLLPCGLGCRDTLRMEAGMPLYGHEMDDEITPLETGLTYFVKMEKTDFIGKAAMESKGKPAVRRVAYIMVDRGIAREHCDIYADGKKIGHVTSGTHCPTLGKPAGMCLIDRKYAKAGTSIEIDVRGKRLKAETCRLPLYKREQ